jgi:hypothetical protein
MPTVIRKADGKEFTVNEGHYSLSDERFTVKPDKPKRKRTVTKRKTASSKPKDD